jgi:hypothetical protein
MRWCSCANRPVRVTPQRDVGDGDAVAPGAELGVDTAQADGTRMPLMLLVR